MTERGRRRSFCRGLEALHADVEAAGPPEGSRERLEERMAQSRARRRRPTTLGWALVAASTSALAVIALWLSVPPDEVAGFVVGDTSRSFQWNRTENGGLKISAGQGSLEARGLETTVQVEAGTRIRRQKRKIHLVAGRARFAVRERPARREPVTVVVSHGQIDVVGTEFTVVQKTSAGNVTLHDGRLQYLSRDGRRAFVEAGETLVWPLVDEPAAAVEGGDAPTLRRRAQNSPTTGKQRVLRKGKRGHARDVAAPPPATPARPDTGAVLATIDRLRIRGEYGRLVETIEAVLDDLQSQSLRESLSYERCDVLAHRMKQRQLACRRMAEHLQTFPNGRYTRLLREAQETAKCVELP